MPRFIGLTKLDGSSALVDADRIVSVSAVETHQHDVTQVVLDAGFTHVVLDAGFTHVVECWETPGQVASLMQYVPPIPQFAIHPRAT